MMRYQRVSPYCLPLTNGGKKPYLRHSPSRASNGDTTITTTTIAGRGFNGGSCTTTTISSLDGAPKGFRFRSTQRQKDHSPSRGGSGDVLLQWGQRKRSRISRAEIRSSTTADDSSSSSGQGRMPLNKLLRKSVNQSMPPPQQRSTVFSGRSTKLRNGLVGGKEFTLSRNLVDRSPNGSPSTNINGRMVSRSTGSKRSPPSPDLIEKRSSVRDQRQNGLDHNHQRVNRSESMAQAHPEVETNNNNNNNNDEGEKATQVEVIEWPRIYIALSRKEKEEDFLVMKGTKLPHRPRKRAKNIDKSLQGCGYLI